MKRAAAVLGCLFLLIMATPGRASAYVDPGSGAMIWQMLAAAAIGSLFYCRRVILRLRARLGVRSPRAAGYLFAAAYAALASPLIYSVFRSHPLPRFGDIFLVGVVLTAYLFTWDSAALLLVLGLAVSAYMLPPHGTLYVARPEDWYRLSSLAVVSIFLICLVNQLKKNSARSTSARKAFAATADRPHFSAAIPDLSARRS